MADITNPEAVRYCNEIIRPLADVATRYYYAALAAVNEWNATDMGTKIPNTTDVVVDGASTDGRSIITGAKVNGLKNHVQTMLTDLQANNNQKLNVLLQIEVNGSP
jgi:hypothetical protein